MWDKARQRWYLKYAMEVADKVIVGSNRGAAIDLGVRIAASLSIEGVAQARHFSAREMLKDWDYWGRKIARHVQELSGRGKKTSLGLSRLYAQSSARWRHAWQAIAREVATCRQQCVGIVYIGWPKGLRESKVYSAKRAGRIHNFWGFDAASRIVQAALERQGILVALHARAAKHKNAAGFADRMSANELQKLATRVWKAVSEYAFGQRGRPRFKGTHRPLRSLEGKSNKQGIRWQAETGCVVWNGIYLPVRLPTAAQDPYLAEALKARTKYVRLVWRLEAGCRRWFAQLVQEGDPPRKSICGAGAGAISVLLQCWRSRSAGWPPPARRSTAPWPTGCSGWGPRFRRRRCRTRHSSAVMSGV
ncbi:transposase [Cupriavidus basilensis]